MSHRIGENWWRALRTAVALVWLYQGLWLKIIAVEPRHLEIVSSVPSFVSPRIALGLIGGFESLLGLAFLLGWRLRLFAWLQIGLLVLMNTAGILFASASIPDVPGMVLMNLVFILAIWGIGHHEKST